MARRMSAMGVLAGLLAASAAWGLTGGAAPPTAGGTINGTVVAKDGSPAAAAQVRLVNQNGVVVARKNANASGVVRFDEVRPGTYGVRATQTQIVGGQPAYFRGEVRVVVPAGGAVPANVTVRRSINP